MTSLMALRVLSMAETLRGGELVWCVSDSRNNFRATVVLGYKEDTPMRLGRPVAPIVLTTEERETLGRSARRPPTAQALALRARLVLRCASGETATAIARDVHVT